MSHSFSLTAFLTLLVFFASALGSPYQERYQEALKIASAMTLEQKIGQTMQIEFQAFQDNNSIRPQKAQPFFLGSLLVSGDGMANRVGNLQKIPKVENQIRAVYSNASMKNWNRLAKKFNFTFSIQTQQGKEYEINPLLGTDAVHGNQHVSGSILFPHNIGLACSHNPQNFYNSGYWTRKSVLESGFNYVFAPTVAVSHNPQWGRYYETMGQEEEYIRQYAKSFISGLQGKLGSPSGVVGSVKHFYSDGATMHGADEGSAQVSSYKSFIRHNTPGYIGGTEAGAGSVMVTYSAINYVPVSLSSSIRSILREKIGFEGFVISDFGEIEKLMGQTLPTNMLKIDRAAHCLVQMMNAGIDMWMIPGWKKVDSATAILSGIKKAVRHRVISEQRINDAVARILAVKLVQGYARLKDAPINREKETHETSQYQDSLTAVHQSMVLLKNDKQVIPLKIDQIKYVILVGQRQFYNKDDQTLEIFRSFNNIGMQCGGWTLRWQGFEGNEPWQGTNKASSNASSLLDALKSLPSKPTLLYANYPRMKGLGSQEKDEISNIRGKFVDELSGMKGEITAENAVIIGVIGQEPYAEVKGDVGVPYCKKGSPLDSLGCLYPYIKNVYRPDSQFQVLSTQYTVEDQNIIDAARKADSNIPLITVLLSGRPMIIEESFKHSQAFVAALLPGTSGGKGILDGLTGEYRFRPKGETDNRNTLAFDWPSSKVRRGQIQTNLEGFPYYDTDGEVPRISDRLFDVGHGLSTSFTSDS